MRGVKKGVEGKEKVYFAVQNLTVRNVNTYILGQLVS